MQEARFKQDAVQGLGARGPGQGSSCTHSRSEANEAEHRFGSGSKEGKLADITCRASDEASDSQRAATRTDAFAAL
jgi:hypothetical protein